jgi:hypothetical protein
MLNAGAAQPNNIQPDRFEAPAGPAGNGEFTSATDFGTLGNRTETSLTIDTSYDSDIFRFVAASSTTAAVQISNIVYTSAGATSAGVDLYLYNDQYEEIGRSTNNGSTVDSITRTLVEGATYYVKVVGYNETRASNYDLTITGPKPKVDLGIPDALAREGSDGASITFTRNGPVNVPLTINYTISGTATNGVDYQALSGTVTIAVLADSVTIPIIPIADRLLENPETVILTATAGAAYALGTFAGTVTIRDALRSRPQLDALPLPSTDTTAFSRAPGDPPTSDDPLADGSAIDLLETPAI